ncbi:GTPase Era involved in 16S rRNA processing [Lipingzhangella halophila]|uniref:GTPase Era involved in 16S rRNA processing n=1 Tax=Lipingzhangella halophila TaxID=1783352 RepID=A0A7W7RJQ6_9ACTN|nr:YfjP family GTPase [Lipingzhangella halophila]MBB4933259.1 GTPase Era involved in 16S rRNA processing [Lipingzhangella halophila]
MTPTTDPPAETDEGTSGAAPEGGAATGEGPDPGAPGEVADPAAERRTGAAEWDGYVVPSLLRAEPGYAPGSSGDDTPGGQVPAWVTGGHHGNHDAGWAPPAGDAWPPNRPTERTGSYPSLRRPVDAQSGPNPDPGEPATANSEPGGAEAEGTDTVPARRRSTEEGAGDGAESAGAAPRGGKHARRSRPARSNRAAASEKPAEGPEDDQASDNDDPDNLAGWVGSLVGAVDGDEETPGPAVIAGRRSGAHGQHTPPSGSAADTAGGADPEPVGSPREAEAEPSAADDPDDAPDTEPARTGGPARWASAVDDDDDEYRPSSAEPWEPMPATTREELIERLDNVALLIETGRDDFDSELIARARGLLTHAGARLRLSGEHTVVALAGGTGSGKSSLFNALCGLEFSRVGITRPTTSSAHACVWGNEGADGILEWLGVPQRARHSRTSVLDKGTSELHGLILLDLPDHDSVQSVHAEQSDRLISSADLLVWVLDPQKYADAAVHHRYFAEMAGHGSVTVAVLNQVDRVASEELEELLTDLRRLLETESGAQPRVLTTSTLTGEGLRELRGLLAETVSERRALIDRLVADLDRIVGGFERYRGAEEPPARVPEEAREKLAGELVEAGGVRALADAAGNTFERRGQQSVGWPVARWARALRRDPLRSVQLDFVRQGSEEGLSESVRAQLPEVETAAAEVADRVGGSLPSPWPRRLRSAARTNVAELPGELGTAVSETVPEANDTPSWWKTVRVLQYLLVAAAGLGLAWFGVALVSWLAGGLTGFSLLDHPLNIGFAAAVVAATLVVGKLTDIGCRNLVEVAAAQQRDEVKQRSAQRVRSISDERIVAPLEEELQRYRSYGAALDAAMARPAE